MRINFTFFPRYPHPIWRIAGVWIAMLTFTSALWADRTLTGKVTSLEDESSLPGVNVVVKGTTIGTITDINGTYSLSVGPEAETLVFSFIGLETKEVAIGNQSAINVGMVSNVEELSEVVVTAFGLEREKKALGYSVQGIDGEAIAQVPNQSVVNNLSGRVEGPERGGAVRFQGGKRGHIGHHEERKRSHWYRGGC